MIAKVSKGLDGESHACEKTDSVIRMFLSRHVL